MNWWILFGLGFVWLGVQIMWVAPRPRQLRAKADLPPVPESGSEAAFGLFWLDQYAWIGIVSGSLGLVSVLWGFASGAQL